MLKKTVTEIPVNPMRDELRKRKQTLRVAAYCRVSTEEEEQQNSFEVQVAYYTDKITHHEGWQLAGIFADDGISGVRTKKRDQFNEMIELCRKKKIDLILTKSISRFARNTLDCIKHVRILKSWGIPVIFEKENIDTSNMNSEMILTCLSSFAQAESESISGNVTKGIRMGYKQGRFAFRYTGFAYQKGPDGEPEIIPKDAETIRMIAQNFLNGDSLKRIKEKLEDAGIPAPAGRQQWQTQAILRILQNEKYAGDVLLQKTYTSDFLEGKVKKNNGELPQYYIQNNHPAILPREVFLEIQEELARRRSKKPAGTKKSKTNRGRFTSKYALSERLVCGNCGSYYRRVTWSIHGRKQIVWRCLSRLEFGPKACGTSPTLEEGALHAAILNAIRSLVQGRQTEMTATLYDTLSGCTTGGEQDTSPMLMENKLKELEQEFDQLLVLAADGDELIKNRYDEAKSELEGTLTSLEALVENVPAPQADTDYIEYFCGEDSEDDEKTARRDTLYALTASLSRSFANCCDRLVADYGYSEDDVNHLRGEISGFNKIKEMIKLASCDYIDLKPYEVDMRYILDTYIRAEDTRVVSELGNMSIVELLLQGKTTTPVDLMMTILASYAQEESRSASENQKWRIRRGFERGELVNLRFLFGYKIEKGSVAVDPEKAAVVREVFRRALEGESLTSLAIDLNRRGFTGVLGGKWNSMRIREMLSNEKYLGNALLQKQYRNNHLEKKEIPNRGELPQYYAEGTHEAIIDQATFDAAQELLAGITENSPVKRPRRRSAFTSMIACAVCGRKYKRCTCGKRHFWNCPTAVQTDLPSCSTSQIPEKLLYDLAAQVLGLAQFDEGVFLERIKGIDALPDKTLVFHFKDGSTAERHWEYISRAKSWTPEMKEIARQRALAQRRGEKWQEP